MKIDQIELSFRSIAFKMTLIVNEEIPGNLTRSAKMVAGTLRTHGDLTGLKLGLAAVMFLYVTVACSLPLIFVHCVQYHSRRRISRQSSESGAWDPEMYSIRTGCISWTPERLAILTGRSNCLAAGALLSVGEWRFLNPVASSVSATFVTMFELKDWWSYVNMSISICKIVEAIGKGGLCCRFSNDGDDWIIWSSEIQV